MTRRPISVPPWVVRGGLRATRTVFASPRVSLRAKRRIVDVFTRVARAPRGTHFDRQTIGRIEAELATPPGVASDGAALLYLHGGGYALGTARAYRGFAAQLALRLGTRAIVPEYRLAPEHPYPGALDDALAVYRGLLAGGQDPERLVIVGDSAGGGLTLALAMMLRDLGDPLPAGLGLICPWLDLAADVARTRVARRDPLIIPELVAQWAQPYVATQLPADPMISPVHGRLEGLPPIVLHSAQDDPLAADADALVAAAASLGDACKLNHRAFARRWHVFHLQIGFLADAAIAVDALADELRPLIATANAPRVVNLHAGTAVGRTA